MPVGKLRKGKHGLVGKIRKVIGAEPNEDVEIVTPQFEREPGQPAPASSPSDRASFEALKTLDVTALRELGLRAWGVEEDELGNEIPGGRALWLFPSEWYSKIPAGLPIVDINFHEETFIPGQTDDDIRFGCLAFGFIGPPLPPRASPPSGNDGGTKR